MEPFQTRVLTTEYPYIWVDATYQPSIVAVSPDGKSLLVPRGEWTRDLMLIENFK